MSSTEEKKSTTKNNSVVCDICNFHFSDETILDLHQKLLHQTSPDKKTGKYNYHCHLCSKQFKMRGSLMVHLRVAHFGFVQNNYRNKNADNSTNGSDLHEQLQPIEQDMQDICTEKRQLTNDQNKAIPSIQQTQSLMQFEKRKILNGFSGSKTQDNKQWECEICLKLFTTKYFLKKHKRLHTGEMPYYCSQCNKYFTFQQSYHKHMLYHSDDKPHICSECGRAFKELSTLHNHERIHSGERPFSCETCGKCFRQRVSYLVHRRIHTGVMPYKCTACNKSFRYKVSQRSHKCPVNPPGCVVRTPDLVEKLIQHQNVMDQNVPQLYQNNKTIIKKNEDAKYSPSNVDNTNSPTTYTEEDFNFLQENFNINIGNNSGVINKYLTESKTASAGNDNINHQPKSHIISVSLPPETYTVARQENIQELVNNFRSEDIGNDKTSSTISVTSNSGNPDFFTLILSPVLSDVQSLCLSNYNETQNNNKKENLTQRDDALETINEESFKELLYGPTTK
ncbi:hypothetical protein ILUMI_10126 [Ignelater luminosus]|uniref:C2H2-type domain-containing protein n=1 Tax=Ignelater luminosus TaxID=2038154 RepID=A0A8K0CYF5_IGNLU|nr:hypothetical protein ILUMI_10126 [Ignelater luminosus]